ncbi:MAG: T9SS type A sorting domain-containing protein [Prevotella sp.]|nr:T9SS type A sorting domain-containing protein [Prevotella sp.]
MRTFTKWKTFAFAALMAAGLGYSSDMLAAASQKNVMCAKTNTGNYFPVVRISMMVVPDGANTFEIVLKDGQGEANVQSISFEKHQEMIDFSKYSTTSDQAPYVDLTKPSWLITSTGKYFKTMNVTGMTAKSGSEKFDVVTKDGTEANVATVYFLRGTEAQAQAQADVASGISAPYTVAEEKLQLITPISESMAISGCGDATQAIVYALDGKQVASAAVNGGNTTIYVGNLPAGVYIVKIGNKSLKFNKK